MFFRSLHSVSNYPFTISKIHIIVFMSSCSVPETYGHNKEEDERIAKIFSLMSEVKRLGYIHFLMTFTKSMKLEDCASWLNDGCDNHDAGMTA